jgi:hypothetical protein
MVIFCFKGREISNSTVTAACLATLLEELSDAREARGIHIALNHNITIAADFEKAFNPQDGTPLGVYIGSYFIF